MKPEILLKAYVQYQSEDAFRDLVAGTLDEVYSTSLRIVQGAPYLAEVTTLRVYSELARKAPRLGEEVVLTIWLRERTCKVAVAILHAEGRAVDRAVLKKERKAFPIAAAVPPAPSGLAIRVCQSIFLSEARHKGFELFLPRFWWPTWIRPLHVGGAAVCVLGIIVWWNNPFHRHNPIVKSQGLQMMPSSFAQLASPEEGGPTTPRQMATTNAATNPNQK
jgi:hypothetical protein